VTIQLSIFGDEIAKDLEDQLALIKKLNLPGIDVRTAWGTNILHFSDEQAQRVKTLCDEADVTIACIGSPLGKTAIEDPLDNELNNLRRIIEIGGVLDTKNIRIFSFYPPDGADFDDYVDEAIRRLKAMCEIAAEHGFTLLKENEKGIVGDTGKRNLALMQGVDHPNLRFIWDPANFVQVGEGNIMGDHWEHLAPYVGLIHIKDARLADGRVVGAGEGSGQLKELLIKLMEMNYSGWLTLEPHLVGAPQEAGFTHDQTEEATTYAVEKLRELMTEVGMHEG